ncbi:MAG: hypothetical protein WAJ85_06730 [Candidatus Baltobacteraceae bacterium]|jgi:hypothetical protein
MGIFGLTLVAALSAAQASSDRRLRANDFCAGSPLTVGLVYNGSTVTDIHVVAGSHGEPVGWIYTMSRGPSYLQANYRMSIADQQALKLSAGEAVSNLRERPPGLPADLDVRPCAPSEIELY